MKFTDPYRILAVWFGMWRTLQVRCLWVVSIPKRRQLIITCILGETTCRHISFMINAIICMVTINVYPYSAKFSRHLTLTCCILTSEIKGNTVPVSAIWHSSERDLCQYLDTGTLWDTGTVWLLKLTLRPVTWKPAFYTVTRLQSFVVGIKYIHGMRMNVIKTFATTRPYKNATNQLWHSTRAHNVSVVT